VPVVAARFDPGMVRSSAANNRRASWVALAVGVVFAIGALLTGNKPGEIPGWIAALVWVVITAAVLWFLHAIRASLYRRTTNPRATGSVTALAVSATGVQLSVGAEVPWAAINSVHLLQLAPRLAFTPGYAIGQAISPAIIRKIGLGRSHVFVLLRDGKAFADSLGDAKAAKIVRYWPGTTPEPADVAIPLDPLVPDAEAQGVVNALVARCAEHGIPVRDYGRTSAALLGIAAAAAGK
jgi:hypothetical protein